MYLEDYVLKYNYTFVEKPFNEVDNLVFSTLIYLNYSSYLDKKLTINELARLYFEDNIKIDKNDIAARKGAYKILKLAMNSPRFKDVLVYNYEYEYDDYSQFGAVTFEFLNTIYVAFEGTDDLVSGWEEDFEMAYHFPVLAHKKATKYLSRYTFTNKNIIVGGHSKGGNLALVSSLRSNFLVRSKILKIYSNDGQGLRKDEIESCRYRRIENKFIHLMPHNTIVGLLFRHKNDTIIKANAPILFSHSPLTWKIEEDHFVRDVISKPSKIFDKGFGIWLNQYDYSLRETFVKEAFGILRHHNIISITEIRKDPIFIFRIIKTSSSVSDKTKEMAGDLIKIINKMIKGNN